MEKDGYTLINKDGDLTIAEVQKHFNYNDYVKVIDKDGEETTGTIYRYNYEKGLPPDVDLETDEVNIVNSTFKTLRFHKSFTAEKIKSIEKLPISSRPVVEDDFIDYISRVIKA